MDEDLDGMSREDLIAEVRKLRAGVRQHRDATGHDLCWQLTHRVSTTKPAEIP